MLTPRPATYNDVFYMSERLRKADAREVYAASGASPFEALESGFLGTGDVVVGADEDNNPVCMGGVVRVHPMAGCVWMLGTTDLEKHKLSFLRRSKPFIDEWHKKFPVLYNCVDERNQLHIKWLQWLGFVFIRRHPEWGFERRPFLEFTRLHV